VRAARWIRDNSVACLIAVLVTAAVVGAGALVLSISDRENGLREAQTEIAELSRLVPALREQTEASFEDRRPAPADAALNHQIKRAAVRAAREIEARWSDPVVTGIVMPTLEVADTSHDALVAGREDRVTAAAADLYQLPREASSLIERLERAGRQVRDKVDDAHSSARILTFAVTGVIGLILSALLLLLSSLRRRRQRGTEERRAAIRGERRLQQLVRHGSDLIAVISPDGTVLYSAGAVQGMLGCEADELEGRNLADRLHPEDAPILPSLTDVGDGNWPARELRLRHRDGTYRTCEARATSLLGDELWNGIVLNIWDVTERKALEERLRHQAFHDDLTALANRVLFNERLQHALVRALREERTVSVLMVDLDDFKAINDSLGHPAGDGLLREAAARLDATMRGADTVARLGGDEFGVILDDSHSIGDDEDAAERIVAALARPFALAGKQLPVSASVGIARARPGTTTTAAELVRDADLAMYAAKAAQKGSVAVYHSEMHLEAEGRLQLKSDLLDAAADGGQFEIHYQPVVDLWEEEVVGLEALLRWNHPRRGMVGPAEFIPIAEETGTIVPIGRRVLRRACIDAQGWIERTGRPLSLGVNVSARQLQDMSLVDDVREALAASGLAAPRLVLEVTETQLLRDVGEAVSILGAVKELGVRIAIDDFGTGYSSLSQLENLPVDVLKVDREFTIKAESDRAMLLHAVIEIGDSLGLLTIAEGVETEEQARRLRALRYRFGQGYLYSRPVPAAAVEGLLRAPTPERADRPTPVDASS
jgi:diguanylate cyclase (GGDEF)-like protein/PAS domain S-box-containing protein